MFSDPLRGKMGRVPVASPGSSILLPGFKKFRGRTCAIDLYVACGHCGGRTHSTPSRKHSLPAWCLGSDPHSLSVSHPSLHRLRRHSKRLKPGSQQVNMGSLTAGFFSFPDFIFKTFISRFDNCVSSMDLSRNTTGFHDRI
jgi:hypothetical protein